MNYRIKKSTIVSLCLLLSTSSLFAREYHVTTTGNDAAKGSIEAPLRTINRAAKLALPGDTITVHQGTYREWINPLSGGESDAKRILYRAAEGERVEIKGSETVTGWKREKKNKQVWKLVLPNSFFGNYNPFNDRLYGDGLWSDKVHHTADVFINDVSLYEAFSLDKVYAPTRCAPFATPKVAPMCGLPKWMPKTPLFMPISALSTLIRRSLKCRFAPLASTPLARD